MTSRREFLKAGLTASALLPVGVRADFAGIEVPAAAVSIYKVLYDTRFAASIAFARRAEARGIGAHAMTGDITPFWYHDLYHRWRQEPVSIAGLTAHGALFCLERLSWEQRMRVVYRGEHATAADGCIAHRFEGPAQLASAAAEAITRVAWGAALADVVAECPRGRARPGSELSLTVHADAVPAEPLFSWVIAPVPRASRYQ